MEIVNFHYVQEEYDDGDVYIPRRELTLTHNQEQFGTINELVTSFKDFLSFVGYLPETIDLITVGKTPLEKALADEEENL